MFLQLKFPLEAFYRWIAFLGKCCSSKYKYLIISLIEVFSYDAIVILFILLPSLSFIYTVSQFLGEKVSSISLSIPLYLWCSNLITIFQHQTGQCRPVYNSSSWFIFSYTSICSSYFICTDACKSFSSLLAMMLFPESHRIQYWADLSWFYPPFSLYLWLWVYCCLLRHASPWYP